MFTALFWHCSGKNATFRIMRIMAIMRVLFLGLHECLTLQDILGMLQVCAWHCPGVRRT